MSEFFIYSLFFGTLLFLFPAFVNFDAFLDVGENRCWFSIRMFRFVKVFGGYVKLSQEGVCVYVGKKIIVIPYAQLGDTGKKFEITKGFQLYRFHQIFEAGLVDKPSGIIVASFVQTVANNAFSVLQTAHPFLSLKNTTLLSKEGSAKITVGVTMIFNGLVLTVALSKKILEVIIEWNKKRKSTVFWKKRRKNSPA